MAAVSLARQAPLRNSCWALAWGLLALVGGCTGSPPTRLVATAPGLREDNGVLRLAGQPYTGTVYELAPTGDTACITPYRQGRAQGRAYTWYGPGQLHEQRPYEAGREQGLAEGWWPNGRRQFQRLFWAGVYQGEVREWYPNGQLRHLAHYADGQETGRQQFWLPDGTLTANYDARNGRQYGFIGSKHCVSPRR